MPSDYRTVGLGRRGGCHGVDDVADDVGHDLFVIAFRHDTDDGFSSPRNSLLECFVEGVHLAAEAGPVASAERVERGAVVRARRRGPGRRR